MGLPLHAQMEVEDDWLFVRGAVRMPKPFCQALFIFPGFYAFLLL